MDGALHEIPRNLQTLHDDDSATTVSDGEDYNIDDWIAWDKVYVDGDAANPGIQLNLPSSPDIFQTEVLEAPRGNDEPVVLESGLIESQPLPATVRPEEIGKNSAAQPLIKGILKNAIWKQVSSEPLDLEAQLKSRKRKLLQKSSDKSCKRRSQFPLASVAVLDDWFHAHQDSPYPTPGELDRLVEQSGLTRKQVSTWLNNARSRKLQKDPMDAYVSSSSDNEAASIEDIRRAAESMPVTGRRHSFSSRQNTTYAKSLSGSSAGSAFDRCPEARWSGPPRRGRRRYGRHASYASSRASSGGSASSVGSAYGVASAFKSFSLNTSQSALPNSPISSNGTKDAKYRCAYPACGARFDFYPDLNSHKTTLNHWKHVKNISGEEIANKTGSKSVKKLDLMLQCTFCKIYISEKSWKRHEETHIPQREWICMPFGHSGAEDPRDSFLVKCVFCSKQYGGCLSSQSCHRREECLARPISDRTFQRKDKLVQHLKRFHKVKAKDFALKAWEVRAADRPWDCGFCGLTVPNWETRTKHIRRHFRDGFDMSSWKSPEEWRSIEEGKENVVRRNRETESFTFADDEAVELESAGIWRKLFKRHSM